MELRQLEYFTVICETGSVTAAAKKLFISQQALSKNVDSMEQELGQTLFFRTRRGIQLTEAGELLRSEAQDLLRQKDCLLESMNRLKQQEPDILRLSFYGGLLNQLPPGYLQSFIRRHPQIRFRLSSYLDVYQTRESINYDVDLFFSTNAVRRNRLELLYEYHAPLCALMRAGHPLAAKDPLFISDLRGQTVVTLNADYDTQNLLTLLLERNNVDVSSCLGDSESDLIHWMVLHQNAVSFFAGPESHLPAGTVKRPIADLSIPWNFYVYGRNRN
nr:LysR family transcriptional regulator [Oscillospiraceae bacterium]